MGNDPDGFDSPPGGGDSSRRGNGPSLKARAVAYLSRREHSRQELRRKLSNWCDDPDAIEAVLDELAREHWQSDQRYAQSYAHRAAARQGTQRILGALRQQGLADGDLAELRATLRVTGRGRARPCWQRMFGPAPAAPREYARHSSFMAGRGFSADCFRRLLGARAGDGRGSSVRIRSADAGPGLEAGAPG